MRLSEPIALRGFHVSSKTPGWSEVGDGSTAQAWAEQMLKGKLKGTELPKVVGHLLEYCQQDTMAMVELVRWLMLKNIKLQAGGGITQLKPMMPPGDTIGSISAVRI